MTFLIAASAMMLGFGALAAIADRRPHYTVPHAYWNGHLVTDVVDYVTYDGTPHAVVRLLGEHEDRLVDCRTVRVT